jgi:RNA polymerase sigma factor (sigma-70 family)
MWAGLAWARRRDNNWDDEVTPTLLVGALLTEEALVQDLIDIVSAAQHGDPNAFRLLVQRYQDLAYAAAFARVGDHQLAQDVAQEAFLQVYRDLPMLREPRAFGSWLRRLVVKHSDRMLRGKHLVTVPLDADLAAVDHQAQPADVAEARELAELVRGEINRLPERERLAVALYYGADHAQNEIAEFLEVPPSTIKKRLHDARRRLKERMMTQLGDHLHDLRPSKDERFARTVQFLVAVRTGSAAQVERALAADPSLLEVSLSGEDWGRAEMGRPMLPLEFDYTPLQFAANYGLHDLADALLRHNADPNVRLHGETPLGRAVLMHDEAMVELLLAHGADPNVSGVSDITPLHRAAIRGHAAIARRLLAGGADAAVRDAFGRTPLDWALLDGWPKVAEALGETVAPSTRATLPPLDGLLLETGIKVVDVLTPLPRGGTIRTTAQGGVGKMVLLAELVARLARRGGRAVFVRWQERFYRPEDASREQMEAGIDTVSKLVLGRMDSAADERERTLLEGVERAEALRDEGSGRDILLLVDAPPTGELPIEAVRPHLGRREAGSITLLVFDLLLPNTGYLRGAVNDAEWDVQLDFDRELARRTIFPAIDATQSWSRLLADGRVSPEHASVAAEVRALLRAGDTLVTRAERATQFQSQPFFVAEPWTAHPGAYVPLEAALAD